MFLWKNELKLSEINLCTKQKSTRDFDVGVSNRYFMNYRTQMYVEKHTHMFGMSHIQLHNLLENAMFLLNKWCSDIFWITFQKIPETFPDHAQNILRMFPEHSINPRACSVNVLGMLSEWRSRDFQNNTITHPYHSQNVPNIFIISHHTGVCDCFLENSIS